MYSEIEKLEENIKFLSAIIEHRKAIEIEDDPEMIELYIECLENIRKNAPKRLKLKPIRESIKTGFGDYKSIQQKCIDLGLV